MIIRVRSSLFSCPAARLRTRPKAEAWKRLPMHSREVIPYCKGLPAVSGGPEGLGCPRAVGPEAFHTYGL